MIEFSYLYKGLCAMARSHYVNAMTGHLGAAVVAGYFFGEDHPDLHDKVCAGIEGELDRIIQGEEMIWYDPEKAGITVRELFEPLPTESADGKQIPLLAEHLSKNIDQTRESGHNVIFTSIAIRALHDHPQYATPSIVQGICKLIARFNDRGPGRGYYGEERGWILGSDMTLTADDGFPLYADQQALVDETMKELVRSGAMHRQGFGGLWHVINHAAALTELSRFGYSDLARQGFAAHRDHIRYWRTLPDVAEELGPMKKATHDPRAPEFWSNEPLKRDSARLTHRIKTLYGFFTLARLEQDQETLRKAEDSLLYLM